MRAAAEDVAKAASCLIATGMSGATASCSSLLGVRFLDLPWCCVRNPLLLPLFNCLYGCSTSKELVRDGRPGDTFPLLAEGLQVRAPSCMRLWCHHCSARVVAGIGRWHHQLATAWHAGSVWHAATEPARAAANLPSSVTCLHCSWHGTHKTCGRSGR